MNEHAKTFVSVEEQARRRKLVEQAAWSAEMEGLGRPLPESAALAELWITGQITREERRSRLHAMMKDRAKRA